MVLIELFKSNRYRLLVAVGGLLVAVALVLFATVDVLPDNSSCSDSKAVAEASVDCGADEVEAVLLGGYGLYLDGEFVAALTAAEDISRALEEVTLTVSQVYGAPCGVHSLYNDIRIIKGQYGEAAFTDSTGLKSLLGDKGNSFDFAVTDVYGTPLSVTLSVKTGTKEVSEEVIVHGERVEKTDALAVGDSITITEGADGKSENVFACTYINGVMTESVLESSVVTAKPVEAVIWQGTEGGASLMSADEKLALPYDGKVSSWYGYRRVFGRSDYHNGIDFVAHGGSCYGDVIYAAADGVVAFADWHSGYGLKLVIDHGDGLSTIYAHCSDITVSVGDAVLKGQPVALIGATGKVTGPHLHFGVMVDGVECNPKPYLDWSSYKDTNIT